MPIITQEQALNEQLSGNITPSSFASQPDRLGIVTTEVKPSEPALGEELAAAIRQENLIPAVIAEGQEAMQGFEYDMNYNPLDDLEGYEDYASILYQSKNKAHADYLKAKIDEERLDRDILQRGGATAVLAQIAAGVLDPTILVPVGAAGGLKNIKSILSTTAAATGTVAAQEMGLQATQLLRTKEESTYAVAGAAILAGALGGGYAAFRKGNEIRYSKFKQGVAQDISSSDAINVLNRLEENDYNYTKVLEEINDSVGAARVSDVNVAKISEEGRAAMIAGQTIKSAAGVEKTLKNMTPLLRTMQSDLLQSRLTIQKLISNPFALRGSKNLKATEQSIEQLKAQYSGKYILAQEKVLNKYKDYVKANKGKQTIPYNRDNLIEKVKAKINKTPVETSFLEEVGKAMRRGDKHPVKEIEAAAKEYRAYFDDIFKDAIDAGIFKDFPDRKTAESYFSRIFDTDAIEEDLPRFTQAVTNYVKQETEKAIERINSKYSKLKENIDNEINGLEINQFRKASFLQEQAELEGKALDMSIEDVKVSLEYISSGAPRKPRTLLKFISQEGGIDIKDAGDLNFDDIKLWNKENFSRLINESSQGAKALDDMALRAWEEGYFPEFEARPDIDVLLSAIDDELRGLRQIVRQEDIDALNDYNYFKDIESLVSQMGLSPKDYARGKILLENSKLQELRDKFIKLSETNSKSKIKKLQEKKVKLELKQSDELADINQMGVDAYSEEAAQEIINNIRGINRVSPEFKIQMGVKGPLKEQKFLIPDEAIEDFIINDAAYIAERYAHNMGTDIELVNKFGSTKLEDIIAPIEREFLEREKELSGDALKKLRADRKADLRNIEGAYQLLRGTYAGDLYGGADSIWKQIGRVAMAYNYVRLLGGVAISSIPDIAKQIQYNGFLNFYQDGLKPFARNIPKLIKRIRPEELKELKLAATTIEHLNNSRAMMLADLGGIHQNVPDFEKFINASAKVFSKATGITLWNNTMQSIAGIMSQKRIIRNVQDMLKGADISAREKEFLSILGLGKKEIKEIGEQLSKYSKKDGDFILANTEQWTNRNAVKAFRVALKKDVESVVLQKNIGDMPLFANSAFGRLILQFKSFVFASTTKTLMTGLQRADKAQIEALTAFISLGALTYIIKEMQHNKEPDLSPENLIIQGIDRSGVLGIFMEANNIAEKVGISGLGRLTGQAPASRYYSRSVDEALFGPSLGTVSNIGGAIYSVTQEGEMSDSDKRNIRKLLPYNNLFYINWLINTADADTKKQFGY